MVSTALSLMDNFNQLTPYAVGFERVFDDFARYVGNNTTSVGFPPYNIRKEGEYNFIIEMALAGFGKKDIEVEVADGTLSIRSVKEDESDHNGNQLYRGILIASLNASSLLQMPLLLMAQSWKTGCS